VLDRVRWAGNHRLLWVGAEQTRVPANGGWQRCEQRQKDMKSNNFACVAAMSDMKHLSCVLVSTSQEVEHAQPGHVRRFFEWSGVCMPKESR
jgi:hypothetical protein